MKRDRIFKRATEVNIHSFTLYVSYCLTYYYLETVNQINPPDYDLTEVLNIFRSAGFSTIRLPSFMSHWIDTIGKFVHPETKRQFTPYIPTITETGDYYDNYFLNANTAHLLPNFRLMFSITLLKDAFDLANVPNPHRQEDFIIGDDYPNIAWLNNTQLARLNLSKVPGCYNLVKTKVDDSELINTISPLMIIQAWPSNLQRYLMLNQDTLLHLKLSNDDIFRHIESITISNINSVGSSLSMIALHERRVQNEVQAAYITPAIPKQGGRRAVVKHNISARHDYSATVKSREEVPNGNIDYATQTPVVRIAANENLITLGQHQHINPQDTWYTQSHEYSTTSFSINEAHAFFRRLE